LTSGNRRDNKLKSLILLYIKFISFNLKIAWVFIKHFEKILKINFIFFKKTKETC